MATLPDPTRMDRALPRPSGGILTVRTGTVEQAESAALARESDTSSMRARDAVQTTSKVAQLSEGVMQLAEQKRKELDASILAEADTKRLDLETEIEYGENGFRRKSMGQVIDPGYLKDVKSRTEAGLAAIRDSLPNDEVRKVFDERHAKQTRDRLLRNAAVHAADEGDKYTAATDAAQLDAHLRFVQAGPADPDRAKAGVEGTRATVANMAARRGLDPVRDATVIESLMRENVGQVHAAIIDGALDSGHTPYAAQYLEANKAEMTEAQIAKLSNLVARRSDEAIGVEIGNTAWAMLEQGESPLAVEKYIAANAKGNQRSTAKGVLEGYKDAKKEEITAVKGDLINLAYDDKGRVTHATSARIFNSKAFLALPGKEQGEIEEYVINRRDHYERLQKAESEEAKAKLEKQDKDRYKNVSVLSKFYSVSSNPGVLANMTDVQLKALEPELGFDNVAKLFALRASTQAVSAGAKLDTGIVNSALKDVKEKYHNSLRGAMQAKLADWVLENPGRTPSPVEQQEIARAGQEEWVEVSKGFFGGVSADRKPGYKVEPGKGYPVDFEEIYPDSSPALKRDKYNAFQVFAAAVQRGRQAKGKRALTQDELLQSWSAFDAQQNKSGDIQR